MRERSQTRLRFCKRMFPIPISSVCDTLSIKHVFENARYRYRFPALTGLHVGPPLLAFEPKDFTGVQPPAIAFAVPQLRMRLNKLLGEMIASRTSVVAFSYATKKRRPAVIAAVMLNGAEVVTEMRRRLDLTEHATLTFLFQKRGWHL